MLLFFQVANISIMGQAGPLWAATVATLGSTVVPVAADNENGISG
jgi:hypothetical protein